MREYPMIIDGKPVVGAASFEVLDPATGECIGRAPRCGTGDLDRAMAAASAAAPAWAADEDARRSALGAAAQMVSGAAGELGEIITAEQGKPLALATGEAHGAAATLRHLAAEELPALQLRDDARARVTVGRRPRGVVAAITPWNYPVAIAATQIAPALFAGNTVVLKPSPFTPLATLRLVDLLRGVFPAGVLNVVAGGDDLGAAMVTHPGPAMVSFTGSVAAGRTVACRAAGTGKHVACELGGNDAAIALDDLEPAAAAARLFGKAFTNTGQACILIKRLYVPRRRATEFADALAELARAARVGNGMAPGTQYGPVSTEPQLGRVVGLVAHALRHGARAASGAVRPNGPGYFYPLTVLVGARQDMPVVAEEQFGPVLPVIGYTDEEKAISMANATDFGLGGSVWSADPERAAVLADRLECGTTWVNTHAELGLAQPLAGWKSSGIGVQGGVPGLEEYTRVRVSQTMPL